MKHDARYYWEKREIVDKAWHNALECMTADSPPSLVVEILNIHALSDILDKCIEKHEHSRHEEHHDNPRPHNPHRNSNAFGE